MWFEENGLAVSKEDDCYRCELFPSFCPLINWLTTGAATLTDDWVMEGCEIFIKKERKTFEGSGEC